MIVATVDGFEITWDAGAVRVRGDLTAEIAALDSGSLVARAGLAASCLKVQADVERRMGEAAYDRDAFEADDRPFRVAPGSAAHARLVLEWSGATIDFDFDEDDDVTALVAEIAAIDDSEPVAAVPDRTRGSDLRAGGQGDPGRSDP